MRMRVATLDALARRIVACEACPRLATHLRQIAVRRKREFAQWTYWARPLPGFGDPCARLLVVGLAPGAHGGSRTGRMFTGDSSAAFLMRAMHRAGFASQPTSVDKEDGLSLHDAYITNASRCAPPENRPSPDELAACAPFLARELVLLERLEIVLALGQIAWDAVIRVMPTVGYTVCRPRPSFAHGAQAWITGQGARGLLLLGSYHPSRQNTNTRRLTEPMLDAIFARARAALERS
jgi:uracil-DNA glycosylase family 4